VEKLLTEFEAHETKEEKSVEVYRKALSAMTDSATRMIMQMIVSDEERHRSMIHAMAATLEGSLNWTKPVASLEGVPSDTELNRKLSRD
jgi:rubrerythrin